MLHLGIPEAYLSLLRRMAEDFDFSLKPGLAAEAALAHARLAAEATLPWERPFLAHIVNEHLFVSPESSSRSDGSYLPRPSARASRAATQTWQLPTKPPPGVTTRPDWLTCLPTAGPDAGYWPAGRAQDGTPLHIAGRVNVYGRQESAAGWLVHQVAQTVTGDIGRLVVIDGSGDVVPRLKRKAAVTRLLGDQLAYIDMDSASQAGGFNPLAAVPGESETALLARWQHWFGQMNVQPPGIQLLAQAQAAGVGDIPALQKWLKQVERQGQGTATASLNLALNRLTASRTLRQWLEWPATPCDILPDGALFFACKQTSWAQRQIVLAVLLAAMQIPGLRLIVNGLPGTLLASTQVTALPWVIISNGPRLPGSAIVLTESHPRGQAVLQKRFLSGDARLGEALALLQPGESLIMTDGAPVWSTWQSYSSKPASLLQVDNKPKYSI